MPDVLKGYARRGLLDHEWDREPLPDACPPEFSPWTVVDRPNCGRRVRRHPRLDEADKDAILHTIGMERETVKPSPVVPYTLDEVRRLLVKLLANVVRIAAEEDV